ncbi:protein ROOT PRIMORDIUM DEFECTIVE 1 [Pyrus ussuriensis x Pyrus communis]|uniref:Protein ROOT PRIMORDIUM DEFECTIVE 1 n=1 Tax=Pyrus ussuriensis x Pyrus communis TaxID=2448454 RepID=A0A5N5F110_9ROSA|nr:protein ROOT PRIMORDIUM DEFECTIVE 1 [Pyrus ussuriensis x Pyrus communis]
MSMNLPNKLKEFLLQHQGIFYISTRGNHGKLHTVYLREAYKKGELIEPNDLCLARRKLAELVLISPRKARMDSELVSYYRDWEDDETGHVGRERVGNAFEDLGGGNDDRRERDVEDGTNSDSGGDYDSD